MPFRRDEAHVFFPWERRRGVRSVLVHARSRRVVAVLGVSAALVLLHHVEGNEASLRITRNAIAVTTSAVRAWRADHSRRCPPSLADLVAAGYLAELPHDAWGHPLRVACPGRKDAQDFEVSSDGPDGVPGGLDRLE